ncbi:MAG: tetratricopeptide repeat protein [Deltaproteobacteria bacterium]|nr:tetratricopeptide repeat protein [Deltaproteobacteria bacterium]
MKNRIFWMAALALGIFFLEVVPAFPRQITIHSEDQFNYARTRMQEGAYMRAVEEFERFIRLFPESPDVPEARCLMGMCYLEAHRYAEARESLSLVALPDATDPLAQKARFLMGESYYREQKPLKAANYFEQVFKDDPSEALRDAAAYRLGWARLRENRWQEASHSFRRVERKSPLYNSALELERMSLKGMGLPYKSPNQAGVMAGLLPGLGHAYAGRYRSAIVSFLLNGLFIWATVESFHRDHDILGGVLAFVEAGWYAGNIYGAVNATHKYNRKLQDDFRKRLNDRFNLRLIASRDGRWGLSLAVRF